LAVTTLPVTKLRIATHFANATVTRVRRHHPPVRALRGSLVAERFTLFALGHCKTCKATHGTEHRNSEEYLDHVPTSIAERLASVPHSAALVDIRPSSIEIIQQKGDARGARRGHLHGFLKCKTTAFVAHDDLPWDGTSPRACKCGAPGMPCPDCNPCGEDEPPKMPPGFQITVDDEGPRN
jgi:hypothetical protein